MGLISKLFGEESGATNEWLFQLSVINMIEYHYTLKYHLSPHRNS